MLKYNNSSYCLNAQTKFIQNGGTIYINVACDNDKDCNSKCFGGKNGICSINEKKCGC